MKGITVTLYERTKSGTDALGNPTYTESPVNVDNVLIGEPSTDDVANATALYQKVIRYMLGIPKGDTHTWREQDVIIFGERFHVFTEALQGIEENVPGPWHHTYGVERYE